MSPPRLAAAAEMLMPRRCCSAVAKRYEAYAALLFTLLMLMLRHYTPRRLMRHAAALRCRYAAPDAMPPRLRQRAHTLRCRWRVIIFRQRLRCHDGATTHMLLYHATMPMSYAATATLISSTARHISRRLFDPLRHAIIVTSFAYAYGFPRRRYCHAPHAPATPCR